MTVTAKILVIDDEVDYLEMLVMALENEGFECVRAVDGRAGLELARSEEFDLVVSDINMPEVDGYKLCRTLRQESPALPIILLTSRDGEVDETLGLELGADDYVTKPVKNRVLIARIRALLRRSQLSSEEASEDQILELGQLRLDRDRLGVWWDDQAVGLTATEFRLLWKLAGSPGRVYDRDLLLEAMRPDDSFVSDRMVDSYVNRVRRKLEKIDPDATPIETVIGVGYRFRTPDG